MYLYSTKLHHMIAPPPYIEDKLSVTLRRIIAITIRASQQRPRVHEMRLFFFPSSAPGRPVFLVSPHLLSPPPEREAEYLSKLAETLLFFLWPKSYGKCAPVRHLLKVIHLNKKSQLQFAMVTHILPYPDFVRTLSGAPRPPRLPPRHRSGHQPGLHQRAHPRLHPGWPLLF